MRTFETIIFDVDGTLIDNIKSYTDTFCRLVAAFFPRPTNVTLEDIRAYYKETTGSPLDQQFRGVLALQCVTVTDEQVDAFLHTFAEHLRGANPYPAFPHARRVLEALVRRRPLPMLFASSASNDPLKKLRDRDLDPYFVTIMGSETYHTGRAHFEAFARAVSVSFDVLVQSACSIGDSVRDMRLARESGITAIGVAHTIPREKLLAAGAHLVVDALADIPDALTALET